MKLQQVLWQNEQILRMFVLSHTNHPDCVAAPNRRCYEIFLSVRSCGYLCRDIFLSRSTIGHEHIHFWFDLIRADVIQLESVPREAMQGLFWCPYFESGCGAHVELSENKHVSVKIIHYTVISSGTCVHQLEFLMAVHFTEIHEMSLSFILWSSATYMNLTDIYIFLQLKNRNFWVAAGNMKIFHLILPIQQRASETAYMHKTIFCMLSDHVLI